MFKIHLKRELASKVKLYEIYAPEIARKTKPGQFVLLIIDEKGERIPLTIADYDPQKGTIAVAFHEVGKSTKRLGLLNEGDYLLGVVGPLGNPVEYKKMGRVLCIGDGVMVAPLYLHTRALREKGNHVISVVVARTKNLLIFERKMREISHEFYVSTDDGSKGFQGLEFIKNVLAKGVDHTIAMGHVTLMKKICETTKSYGIKTMVTLTPIMVDGMGMCGACRVTVGDRTLFACVDGPEFDGHLVDFDELMLRQRMYIPEERLASILDEKLRVM